MLVCVFQCVCRRMRFWLVVWNLVVFLFSLTVRGERAEIRGKFCFSKFRRQYFSPGARWREQGCTRAECVIDRVTGQTTAYVAGCRPVDPSSVAPGCRVVALQPQADWPRCCPRTVCDARLISTVNSHSASPPPGFSSGRGRFSSEVQSRSPAPPVASQLPTTASIPSFLLDLAKKSRSVSCNHENCTSQSTNGEVSQSSRTHGATFSRSHTPFSPPGDSTFMSRITDSVISASSLAAIRQRHTSASSGVIGSSPSSPTHAASSVDPAVARLLARVSSVVRCRGGGTNCSRPQFHDQPVRAHIACLSEDRSGCLAQLLLAVARDSADCRESGECSPQLQQRQDEVNELACEGNSCVKRPLRENCHGESCLGRALVEFNLRHEENLEEKNKDFPTREPVWSVQSSVNAEILTTPATTEHLVLAERPLTTPFQSSSLRFRNRNPSAERFTSLQSTTSASTLGFTVEDAPSPFTVSRFSVADTTEASGGASSTSSSDLCATGSGQCSHGCRSENRWNVQCTCPDNMMLSDNGLDCVVRVSEENLSVQDEGTVEHPFTSTDHNPIPNSPSIQQSNERRRFSIIPQPDKLQKKQDSTGPGGSRDPQLLFSSRDTLYLMQLDGSNLETVATQLSNAVGLDYDLGRRCIYWTVVHNVSTVNRKCDYRDPEVLYSGRGAPDNIAVDWITGNIYWTDGSSEESEEGSSGSIHVLSHSAEHHRVIIRSGLSKPRAICHLPELGRMYYTDWGEKPFIGTAGMDGSDPKVIVSGDLVWPNALTISRKTRQLFWADAKMGQIEVSDLGGRHRRVLLQSPPSSTIQQLQHIFSLAVFEQQLIWSSWETNGLIKYNGSHAITLRKTHSLPMSLRVLHQSLQRPLKKGNLCERASCSHLCLLAPAGSGVSARCACPEGLVPSRNDSTRCSRPPDTCERHEFVCESLGQCMSLNLLCDGKVDCPDSTDEPSSCPPFNCSSGEFQCRTGQCILRSQLCDGLTHCLDGGDEVHCAV